MKKTNITDTSVLYNPECDMRLVSIAGKRHNPGNRTLAYKNLQLGTVWVGSQDSEDAMKKICEAVNWHEHLLKAAQDLLGMIDDLYDNNKAFRDSWSDEEAKVYGNAHTIVRTILNRTKDPVS